MEITLDAIISLAGILLGGGGGAFFTWRFMRRKAKAEAETAEVDAAKELQDMYQQMLADAKTDREDRKHHLPTSPSSVLAVRMADSPIRL